MHNTQPKVKYQIYAKLCNTRVFLSSSLPYFPFHQEANITLPLAAYFLVEREDNTDYTCPIFCALKGLLETFSFSILLYEIHFPSPLRPRNGENPLISQIKLLDMLDVKLVI
jgi:hypothetical protein